MSVKTVVESISTKEVTTKFGKKLTYSFKGADGQWYSMAFKKPAFGKGEEVEFEFESTKYGNNVTAVLSTHTGTAIAPEPAAKKAWEPRTAGSFGSKGVFPIPATDGQRSIIRQNALTNARELVVAAYGSSYSISDSVDKIIAVAKQFEHYSAGDTEAAEARKALAEKETK